MNINNLFEQIKLPVFLKPFFEKENWFEIQSSLINIIEKNIPETKILTSKESMKVTGRVFIGEDCKIGENVVIEGPAFIGNNVTLSSFSYIRPGSIIADNCRVGSFGIVKNSVMMEGSSTSDYCYLGDSIMGVESMMGAHSSTLNQRFDKKENKLVFEGESVVDTNLLKYGVILGEKSRIGGGSLTLPGCVIAKRTFIAAGIVVSGYIEAEKFVNSKSELDIRDNAFAQSLR